MDVALYQINILLLFGSLLCLVLGDGRSLERSTTAWRLRIVWSMLSLATFPSCGKQDGNIANQYQKHSICLNNKLTPLAFSGVSLLLRQIECFWYWLATWQ